MTRHNPAERPREQRIAVVDEIASSIQEPVLGIREIARDLAHPCSIRSGNNSGDLDSTGLEINDDEYEIPNQARSRYHFDAEEIGR